jgi:hypothetical protein
MRHAVPGFVGLLASLATVVATADAGSAAAGIAIAGGQLDQHFPGAEVYLAVPAQAIAPEGKACLAARRYVEYVNAGQFLNVASLFADEAVILEPTRQIIRGMARIRSFYEGRIDTLKPQLVAVAYLGDSSDCMVELATRREVQGQQRYALVSIDHFTVGSDGKILRMVAFARPPRTE